MVIGVPKEIKDNESRVAIVPSGVRALKEGRHRVLIEEGAGEGSGITDEEFRDSGAEIFSTPDELYKRVDMILKVKEPLPQEHKFLRDRLILFTFLHLAANKLLAASLIRSGGTSIAYETIEEDSGRLPVLAPMSEIAGKLAVQVGANCLMKHCGGKGALLGGVPGVERGHVVIIGAGSVGINAAKVAFGLGARVTIINTSVQKLRYLDDIFSGHINTLVSNSYNIEKAVVDCDLLVGAVHFPGARTIKLVTREMVSKMKKGSVIVDVSVDQGGCVETIRPTTHSEPTYEVDGVVHYGVSNMPGAVPRTSTFALTNVTLPYVLGIAELGLKKAVQEDPALGRGVNIHMSRVTHPMVADALGKEYSPLSL